MSARFGFSAPNDGKTVADLDESTPLFVVRSGQDTAPGLNGTLDRFVAAALESNLPITFVNLPHAPHAFDTLHDTGESRDVINWILAFMRTAANR
jgi:acetyl esterase/lipase